MEKNSQKSKEDSEKFLSFTTDSFSPLPPFAEASVPLEVGVRALLRFFATPHFQLPPPALAGSPHNPQHFLGSISASSHPSPHLSLRAPLRYLHFCRLLLCSSVSLQISCPVPNLSPQRCPKLPWPAEVLAGSCSVFGPTAPHATKPLPITRPAQATENWDSHFRLYRAGQETTLAVLLSPVQVLPPTVSQRWEQNQTKTVQVTAAPAPTFCLEQRDLPSPNTNLVSQVQAAPAISHYHSCPVKRPLSQPAPAVAFPRFDSGDLTIYSFFGFFTGKVHTGSRCEIIEQL